MLKNKTIILGVTGCIAAYKSCEIVRELKSLGADVWVVMTDSAVKFVTPLTFRTLSNNPVICDLFGQELANIPVPHISLTQKADLILVAPATANILAKAAGGLACDALSTIILSAKCPVIFAPAMNTEMWNKEATADNISKLKIRGHKFIGPERGPLACGDEGIGRLSSVETIIEEVKRELLPNQDLLKKRVLVTAGPTREAIDPVRYISNRSSGKMGYALAEAALKRGAAVTLITGPTDLTPPGGVALVKVETAEEMYNAVATRFDRCDILIMAAAVADFKPRQMKTSKIKKSNTTEAIEIEETTDILKELGKKKSHQILIGFALETDALIENAKTKLKEKNLDLIVANDPDAFDLDENKVTLISCGGGVKDLGKMKKAQVAQKILDAISSTARSNTSALKLSSLKNE
jgi:phosphopantothenoylcysteine decarboxylase/phosphopantothenate--cysteine ligase